MWRIKDFDRLQPSGVGKLALMSSEDVQRFSVDLVPEPEYYTENTFSVSSLSFSPDGSKFAASYRGTAYVYDVHVASLARLGVYEPPGWRANAWDCVQAIWTQEPDSDLRLLVTWSPVGYREYARASVT